MAHETVIADGTFDFGGGVDSNKPITIKSDLTPNGLNRNQLAWAMNCTQRGSAITQRTGWRYNGTVHDGSALYQGGWMYEPMTGGDPWLILSIGGHIYSYVIDTAVVADLSTAPALVNPTTADQAFMCQGEEFLVIQSGDGSTLPLFYDGATLRRSIGITTVTPGGYVSGVNEIPAATAMDYYKGRFWFAQGHQYAAGDIVKGPSGTVPYARRDAILNVTEAPLCFSGDGFAVPDNAGNIRAIKHAANINVQLGEGKLYIATRKAVYSLEVPDTRADWITTSSNNQPKQTIAQLENGWVNDRSVVAVSGDLYGQSLEPAIRSLNIAVKNFGAGFWGNVPISSNIERALAYNDRSLMRFASGIHFDNRLWQAILPKQLPQGVIHQGVVTLDFTTVQSFDTITGTYPDTPAWEGAYYGLQILQLFVGDFGGRERAFAAIVSEVDGSIQVWELTMDRRVDAEDSRVLWQFETPAWTWGSEREMKKLVGGELWISKLSGTVDVEVYYRSDADPCWRFWHRDQLCVARNCAEDTLNPNCSVYPYLYPYTSQTYREGYSWPLALPAPKAACDSMGIRPTIEGYQFQVLVVIKGWCQVRGMIFYAEKRERTLYQGLKCAATGLVEKLQQLLTT